MRLTKKIDNYYHIIHNWSERNTFEDQNKEDFAIQKFGQLEDIEDELGIDLITLFKALKKGCYVKNFYTGEVIFAKPCLFENKLVFFGVSNCNAKDYGETWALTKEELE